MEIFGSSIKGYSSTFNLWFVGSCGGIDAPEMACVKVVNNNGAAASLTTSEYLGLPSDPYRNYLLLGLHFLLHLVTGPELAEAGYQSLLCSTSWLAFL